MVRCSKCGAAFAARAETPASIPEVVPAAPPAEVRVTAPAPAPAPPAPAPAVKPGPTAFPPVEFPVIVQSAAERSLHGAWQGQLSSQGLALRRPGAELLAPVGTPAHYDSGNRLRVTVNNHELALAVGKSWSQRQRLARDCVALLRGAKPRLQAGDYVLPIYLVIPSILMMFLILVPVWQVLGMEGVVAGVLGGALWGVVCSALAVVCYWIVQKPSWQPLLRFGLAMGLVLAIWFSSVVGLVGYHVYQALQNPAVWNETATGPGSRPVVQQPKAAQVPARQWQEFAPPNGRFAIDMPGAPAAEPRHWPKLDLKFTMHTLEMKDPALTFQVGYADLPARDEFPFHHHQAAKVEGAREALTAQYPGSQVLEEGHCMLDGTHNGDFFYLGLDGADHLVARVYRVGRRAFIVSVRGPDVGPRDADVVKYLDSFAAGGVFPGGERLPAPAAWPGVAAYWPLDEGQGAQAADVVEAKLTATAHHVAWKRGVRGKCLSFGNREGRLVLPGGPALDFNGKSAFTIAGWVRAQRPDGGIVSFKNEKGQASLEIFLQRGRITVSLRDDNAPPGHWWALQGPPAADGDWHHFALTRQAEGQLELLVDGQSYGKSNNNGPIWSTVRLLGFKPDPESALGRLEQQHLTGEIDEFCVFKRALTEQEVNALAGKDVRTLPGADPDLFLKVTDAKGEAVQMPLLARWTFDDRNQLGGTLHGGRLVPGVRGQALELNGKGDYFDYGKADKLNFGRWFTIAGWVRTDRKNGVILSQRHSEDQYATLDVLVEDGSLVVRWQANRTTIANEVSGGSIADGRWHHFAVVREVTPEIFTQIYVDGVSQGRKAAKHPDPVVRTDLRAFGAERRWLKDGGVAEERCYLQGALDEITFFDLPLPPAAIKQVMTATGGAEAVAVKPPPPPTIHPNDVQAPRERHVVPVERPSAFALTPDGKTLVAATRKELKFWDAGAGKEHSATPSDDLSRLVYSPDGQWLAACQYSGRRPASLRDATGQVKRPIPFRLNADYDVFMAFSPDSKQLAVVAGPVIRLMEVATLQQRDFAVDDKAVFRGVQFSADGKELRTVADRLDNFTGRYLVVQTWNLASRQATHRVDTKVPAADLRNGFLTADARYLAGTEGAEGVVHDIEKKETRRLAAKDENRMYCLTFAPDLKTVLTGHHNGTLRVWDAATGKLLQTIQAHVSTEPVSEIQVSADGKLFITKMREGIKVFDWQETFGRPLEMPPLVAIAPMPPPPPLNPPAALPRAVALAQQQRITGMALAPDGKLVATTSAEHVALWDGGSGAERALLEDKSKVNRSILFTPDGQWLIHTTADNRSPIQVREAATGKAKIEFKHGAILTYTPLAVSPDSKTLAVVNTSFITLWQIPSGEKRELVRDKPMFSAARFSADGRTLRTIGTRSLGANAGLEVIAQLWDVQNGKLLDTRQLTTAKAVQTPVVSPDGRFAAVIAAAGAEVAVLDLDAADEKPALSGKLKGVDRMAFSPDNRSLAVVRPDGKLQLWDVARGEAIAEVDGTVDRGRLLPLVFSADGKTLAVSGASGVALFEVGKALTPKKQ